MANWQLKVNAVFPTVLSMAALGGVVAGERTFAQIIPDRTLGNEGSVVTPVEGSPVNQIDGGAVRGSNLFHSFREFSVPTGGEAFFINGVDIDNIFSRVTGGRISNIDGLIRANGTANLFLLNPAGILFGPNARLDIGGSFLGSTASGLAFPDGIEFNATEQTTPLLTINIPIGLRFRGDEGNIAVREQFQNTGIQALDNLINLQPPPSTRQQERLIPIPPQEIVDSFLESATTVVNFVSERPFVGLQVRPGRTLALVGGEISLIGGQLRALQGRIELGSVAETGGLVSLTPVDRGWALGYEGIENFQNISLSGLSLIDVSGLGSGDVRVRGHNVILTQGSSIVGATEGHLDGGEISIDARQLNLEGSSLLGAIATPGSSGNSGNITLEAESLKLEDSIVFSLGLGQGDSGNLTVKAPSSMELTGTFARGLLPASLTAATASTGAGGTLIVETGNLIARDGAQISVTTGGDGPGGSIEVFASDSIELSGESENRQFPSGLFAPSFGTGEAGDLRIETGRLFVLDGASVSATTRRGKGGNVEVRASESIEVSGTTLDGRFESGLATLAIGRGNENTDNLQGGDLLVTTRQLIVRDGAQISASGFGTGQGGLVVVNASEFIELRGESSDGLYKSGLLARANLFPAPFNTIDRPREAGDLIISTRELTIRDGAEIAVSGQGLGIAGNLDVTANNLLLDNGTINANTGLGNLANITLTTSDIQLRNNSSITTNARDMATGGNITIDTDFLTAFPSGNNDITANAFEGEGGFIDITARGGIFGLQVNNNLTAENDITAFSQLDPSLNGTIALTVENPDPSDALSQLPQTVVDANDLIAQNLCRQSGDSEFTIAGRGGIPQSPSDSPNNREIRANLIELKPTIENSATSNQPLQHDRTPSHEKVPTRGWIVQENGEVLLVSYDPTATGPQRWQQQPTCQPPAL